MISDLKVLFLPKHSILGASSRYRTFQYLPFLKKKGIFCEVRPLFNEEHLRYKYKTGENNKLLSLIRIFDRVKVVLFEASSYDLVVIEKELIPYFPPLLEKYLIKRNIKYILDYDDAIWHSYDKNKNFIIKYYRESKIEHLMKNAEAVICGSDYILNYAKKSESKKTYKIPTVVEMAKYKQANNKGIFTIGWIGSPGTSKYIVEINDILKRITDEFNVIINLIGFDRQLENTLSFNHLIIAWSDDTEIQELMKLDIGIMPLSNNLFERGKCGFKLVQYMSSGIPVIASSVGENNIIIDHEINGFLVKNDNDWYTYIKYYIEHTEQRKIMGDNALNKAKQHYTLEEKKYEYLKIIKNTIKKEV
jgi:glycosyltransferase involved in cell wall biosynthesis